MYLLDEQFSPDLVIRLQEFGEPFSLIYSIYDVFGPSTKDEPLIPLIVEKNLILVTRDRKMRNKRGKNGHYFILKEYDLRVLFLPNSCDDMKLFEQMAFFTRYWVEIHEQVMASTARLANITATGRVITFMETYL